MDRRWGVDGVGVGDATRSFSEDDENEHELSCFSMDAVGDSMVETVSASDAVALICLPSQARTGEGSIIIFMGEQMELNELRNRKNEDSHLSCLLLSNVERDNFTSCS